MKVKIRVSLSIMMATLSFSAESAEYSVTPFASARAEADTSRRLASNADNNYGANVGAGALFQAVSDTSSLSVTPSVSLKQFSNDGTDVDQDSEDYFLDMRGDHRFNEKFSVGAFLNYQNVGVVDNELEDLGITFGGNDIASTGLLLANENFSREVIRFGPSITYIMSDKNSLSFGGGYTEATYDNQNTDLSDYTNYSINASWIRQLSLTDQFIVSIFTSKNDPDLNNLELGSIADGRAPATLNNEIDETGVTFGYVRSFSDTLTGNISVGMRSTKGDFPDLTDFDIRLSQPSADAFNGGVTLIDRLDPRLIDPVFLNDPVNQEFLTGSSRANLDYQQGRVDNNGLVLAINFEKRYTDQTILTAGITRASVPTGRGLVERDEFSFGGIHEYSDRITARGTLRYFSTESISEETLSFNSQSTDQLRLEAGLDWRLTEFWTLGGGYTFRRRSPDNGESVNGHGVFVSIGYNGNKYAISR